MVLNGAIGAKLHIPFSVVVRASFGYYFAYFCIISRSILAMFWLGIQGMAFVHPTSPRTKQPQERTAPNALHLCYKPSGHRTAISPITFPATPVSPPKE